MAGLYIHIPFCHAKCSYCDFYSMPHTRYAAQYVEALAREWEMRSHEIGGDFDTLYIGGGTPSILPHGLLRNLVEKLGDRPLREFTIEANPEDVTPAWVDFIASIGVNRVSIGVQSLIDSELKAINRRHSAPRALEALATLRRGGIVNVSADLIYGLPGQTPATWQHSLDSLVATGVCHISAYSLSYEPGTRLYAMLQAGKIREAGDDLVEEMYGRLTATLHEAGFRHYEISNFAIPGMEAVHNSNYWNFTPYLGLGAAAHSFDGNTRRMNPPSATGYVGSIQSGTPYFTVEHESACDLLNDYIITRLRTDEGIDKHDFLSRFGHEALLRLGRDAARFIASSLMRETASHIAVTEKAFLVSDAILRDLIR